jgi:hypothetical protein
MTPAVTQFMTPKGFGISTVNGILNQNRISLRRLFWLSRVPEAVVRSESPARSQGAPNLGTALREELVLRDTWYGATLQAGH